MVQVGTRSFSDSSSVSGGQARVFDITTERDSFLLLQAVHRSVLSADEKNELRDTFFNYKQNTSSENLQQTVSLFNEHGFTLQTEAGVSPQSNPVPAASSKSTHAGGFGRARLSPRFAPTQKITTTKKPVAQKAAPTSVFEAPVQTKSEASAQADEQAHKEEPVITTPEPVEPPPASTSTPIQAEQSGVTYGNPLERIKAIKHAVNEKVGNPVTLIDVDATVGREYMSALLNAMKLVNGGNAQDLNTAMERLEKVYAQVEVLDLDIQHKQTPQEAPQTPPDAVAKAPEPAVQVKVPVTSNVPKAPEQKPADSVSVPQEKSEVSTQEPSAPDAAEKNTQEEHAAPLSSVSKVLKSKETKVSDTTSAPQPEIITKEQIAKEVQSAKEIQSTRESVSTHKNTSQGLTSVGKEKQIQDLMKNNRAAQVEENKKAEAIKRANTEPLQLPEVTAGLNQLLSEWSLFKSSGFFGVGPSGADHPLYKKLQALTMAAVIAGRFEGATPQIKQSITDYMNGWRYEEGIMHEHAETFEHYLRRVIKHILAKQGNTVGAR